MTNLLEAMAVKICTDECPVYDPYEGFSPYRSGPRWKCFVEQARKQLATPEMKRVIDAARAEGFKAGQKAMRERAAVFRETQRARLKGGGEDGYKIVTRDADILPSEQAEADAIRTLPIEEPPTKS